ncbi:MAG: hypothetical protein OEZ22_07410 [Spirochaetia bacterium]|nr:hypothetical protein [Spirochaetia bacterium]
MKHSVLTKDIIPSVVWFFSLVIFTIIIDLFLHLFELAWIGRYLGIPGTLFIIASFLYSLRKRKIITEGSPKFYLQLHEFFSWLGTLLVLIHSGIHFNAYLPWAASIAMLIAAGSGLAGRYLVQTAKDTLKNRKEIFLKSGLSENEIESKIFWDSIAVKTVNQWRVIHKPITSAFAVLALAHIITIFMFWEKF